MLLMTVLLSSFLVMRSHAADSEIIMNEDDLVGTCTGTCNEIPTVDNRNGCRRIYDCRTSSTGWNRGFVRCDYCACKCEKELKRKDAKVTTTKRTFTEPDLYGTCTGTCPKKGLVRSNYRGCEEVRDCYKERNGWTRGFVRCDYCRCECKTTTYSDKYELRNVKYDLSRTAKETQGTLKTMTSTVLENKGSKAQKVKRTLTFQIKTSTQMSTTASITAGMEVSVEAGVSVGVADISTTVSTSLSTSFEYTQGKTNEETKTDTIEVEIEVQPRSSIEVLVTGHKMTVNIPYTADLVTIYKDGSKSTKKTSGTFTNVSMGKFRVSYGRSQSLSK